MNYSDQNKLRKPTFPRLYTEISSVISEENHGEYIRQSDKSFCSGQAPLLFPISRAAKLTDAALGSLTRHFKESHA